MVVKTFKKYERIKKSREIRDLQREGKRWKCDAFCIIYKKSIFFNSRLCIAVSRKCGKAVVRNRIKRIIREIFRNTKNTVPAQTDILVQIRPGIESTQIDKLTSHYQKWLDTIKN